MKPYLYFITEREWQKMYSFPGDETNIILTLQKIHNRGAVQSEREKVLGFMVIKLPQMPDATKEELELRERFNCPYIRQGEYFNTAYCGLTGKTPHTMKFCRKQTIKDECDVGDMRKADFAHFEPIEFEPDKDETDFKQGGEQG